MEEWYKAFGKKVLRDVDLKEVTAKIKSEIDKTKTKDNYWKYSSGDPIFNRRLVVGKLLEMKKGEDFLLDNYDSYQLACWYCSAEIIKNIPLQEYKDSDSHVDFAKRIDSDSKLMGFWYRYNILYGSKSNEFHENDKGQIKQNLEELFFDYHIPVDSAELWRYGFECAKEEGCVEALEFFFEEIKKEISKQIIPKEEKERKINELLIDTALYAADSTVLGLRHSNAHIIDFCLTHIVPGQENYKKLLKEDHKTHGYYAVLDKLKEKYLFGHVAALMDYLDELTPENYSTHFIYAVGHQIGDAPNKELRDKASAFLENVWENKKFKRHKEYCLDELNQGDPALIHMLFGLAQVGALEPLKKIWDAADKKTYDKLTDLFLDSCETRCALYIEGEKGREILYKVISTPDIGPHYCNAFVKTIDKLLEEDKSFAESWDILKKSYENYDIKGFKSKFLDRTLEEAIGKNMNSPSISQSDDPAFSSPEAPLSSTPQRGNQELLSSTRQSRGRDLLSSTPQRGNQELLSSTTQSRGQDLLSFTPRSSEQKALLSKKTAKKLF